MASTLESSSPLAVLIDADNASPSVVDAVLAEVAKLGVAHVKRIYGDWTSPNLGKWKDALLQHSIQPMQQFPYTKGKNATDSAMIIDAMDLLYTGSFAGFCLVSSDSDFTRLAGRLREAGKRVYGFGEKKTPQPFVKACDRFIYTELLPAGADPQTRVRRPSVQELQADASLVNLLSSAIEAASEESGWANLAAVGSHISKQSPDFDSRTFGFSKLGELADAIGLFNIDRRDKVVFIRDDRRKPEPL
jgi:uncharacterized LabA/DUF88 family protein